MRSALGPNNGTMIIFVKIQLLILLLNHMIRRYSNIRHSNLMQNFITDQIKIKDHTQISDNKTMVCKYSIFEA